MVRCVCLLLAYRQREGFHPPRLAVEDSDAPAREGSADLIGLTQSRMKQRGGAANVVKGDRRASAAAIGRPGAIVPL
jgi:hypothetical protein